MPTYRNDSTSYQTVVDVNGDRVQVAPAGTVQTYQILPAATWTKTADTPYYNIAKDVHTVTAAGAETKSQAVDPDNRVLEVRSDVAVTIHANSASAEGYPLQADDKVQIRHEGNIEALYLVFSAAGEATVIELED